MRKIPLRNGLPGFIGDDVDFICTESVFGKLAGEAGTITDIVRALGLEDRTSSGGPTTAYLRVRMALKKALSLGRVRREGRSWALPLKTRKAS